MSLHTAADERRFARWNCHFDNTVAVLRAKRRTASNPEKCGESKSGGIAGEKERDWPWMIDRLFLGRVLLEEVV